MMRAVQYAVTEDSSGISAGETDECGGAFGAEATNFPAYGRAGTFGRHLLHSLRMHKEGFR